MTKRAIADVLAFLIDDAEQDKDAGEAAHDDDRVCVAVNELGAYRRAAVYLGIRPKTMHAAEMRAMANRIRKQSA